MAEGRRSLDFSSDELLLFPLFRWISWHCHVGRPRRHPLILPDQVELQFVPDNRPVLLLSLGSTYHLRAFNFWWNHPLVDFVKALVGVTVLQAKAVGKNHFKSRSLFATTSATTSRSRLVFQLSRPPGLFAAMGGLWVTIGTTPLSDTRALIGHVSGMFSSTFQATNRSFSHLRRSDLHFLDV